MQLSDRQQKTVAVALTLVASAVISSAVLGLFWLLASFVRAFSQVFLPPVVAAVLALLCQPYYEWLHLRKRLPTPLAIAALFLSVMIPVGLVSGFFGVMIFEQLADFVSQLPVWWQQLYDQIEQHWPDMRKFFEENVIGQRIAGVMRGQGPLLAHGVEYFVTQTMAAGASAAEWVGALLSWVVTPVYFVFFLMAQRKDLSQLDDFLPFLKPETRRDVTFLAQEFVNIIVAFFRGQLIIAFLQGLLFAIGFHLVGLKYGLVLGFLLGFLNIIPYLGSMVGLGVTLPLSYFQEGGGPLLLMLVLGVFALVQTVEGYVLTPRIMGNRTGLHPMVIILAVFFWGTALGGILGMILAIPLTAFLVVFWRLAKEKYITELV